MPQANKCTVAARRPGRRLLSSREESSPWARSPDVVQAFRKLVHSSVHAGMFIFRSDLAFAQMGTEISPPRVNPTQSRWGTSLLSLYSAPKQRRSRSCSRWTLANKQDASVSGCPTLSNPGLKNSIRSELVLRKSHYVATGP